MHGDLASASRLHSAAFTRRHGFALHLSVCFVWIALAAGFVSWLDKSESPTLLLWFANGVLLAYLLVAPAGAGPPIWQSAFSRTSPPTRHSAEHGN